MQRENHTEIVDNKRPRAACAMAPALQRVHPRWQPNTTQQFAALAVRRRFAKWRVAPDKGRVGGAPKGGGEDRPSPAQASAGHFTEETHAFR
jgi:hypothetical protein